MIYLGKHTVLVETALGAIPLSRKMVFGTPSEHKGYGPS